MKKFLYILALFVFVLSLASVAHAESGSDDSVSSGGETLDVNDSMSVNSAEDSEDDSDVDDSGDDLEEDLDDDATEELDDDSTGEDLDDDTSENSVSNTGYVPQCVVAPELYQKMLELEKRLRTSDISDEDAAELKSQIAEITTRIRTQKNACIGTTRSMPVENRPQPTLSGNAVAVGVTCELSSDLKEDMTKTLREYKLAIESKDFEKAKELRAMIAELEDDAREERRDCMEETVPGLIRQELKNCTIPKDIYDKLEQHRYKVSELKSLNLEVPEELRETISELESKIAHYKARCNALKVSDDVEESDVAQYYRQRMIEAMETEDMDSRVQSLKELRQEIDETIKNMIEEKKRFKYSEMDGVAERIEFKAGKVRVGDSETNSTEVEVEVEVDDDKKGSVVRIRPTELAVLLSQEGYNVTAEDITVNETGIYVQDVLVKTLPAAVFENNKNLERNAQRILMLKLEKEDDKAVYTAEYEVKKRILGIIPAKARHELKIDAENGETLSDKRPWWSAISTTVDEDIEEDIEDIAVEDVIAAE